MSSAKRQAGRQLTHDNWDDEEEAEEAGVFKQADESEMKNRVIKKAKRRGTGISATDEDGNPKAPLFTGFKGFGIPTPQGASLAFNKTEDSKTKPIGGFAGFGATNGTKTAGFGSSFTPAPSSTTDKKTEADTATSQSEKDNNSSKFLGSLKVLNESMLQWMNTHMDKNPYCYFTPVFNDYANHLASLKTKYNFDEGASSTSSSTTPPKQTESSKLVTPNSAQSPAPTFSFGSTQKASQPEAKSNSLVNDMPFKMSAGSPPQPSTISSSPAKSSLFSFAPSKTSEEQKNTSQTSPTKSDKPQAASAMFSFGNKTSPAPEKAPGSIFGNTAAPASGGLFGSTATTGGAFSFGTKPAAGATTTPFSFGKTTADSGDKPTTGSTFTGFGAAAAGTAAPGGFSFKSAIASASANGSSADGSSAAAGNDDEEYVPPKAEVENKISEDDSVYNKRVKMFYEKDGKYVDKGIGNLFIKALDNGKHSLLIRADTNLGNILLNIQLAESIPIKRMGKNNVTLVCVPNPPMDPKAKDSTSPTMLLIRVKTDEDADELCDKLNEYKKD